MSIYVTCEIGSHSHLAEFRGASLALLISLEMEELSSLRIVVRSQQSGQFRLNGPG